MMKYTRHTKLGLTLTEMLVVVSIIVTISALSIPMLSRTGFFTADRSRAAARDVYQMLRAARLYATTNNVETALVYRTRMVFESAKDENGILDLSPVIDGYAICRKLTDDEIADLNNYFTGVDLTGRDDIFVPVEESNGRFREMPDSMAVLSDVFQFAGAGLNATNANGLEPVFVVDPFARHFSLEASPFMLAPVHPLDPFGNDGISNDGDAGIDEPDEAERLHFDLGDGDISTAVTELATVTVQLDNGDATKVHAFPAHRFLPTGEMVVRTGQQRFEMRVGLQPDQLPQDRFVADPLGFDPAVDFEANFPYSTLDTDAPSDVEVFLIRFHRFDPIGDADGDDMGQFFFYDPRRPDRDDMDNAFDQDWLFETTHRVELFASTGRVRVNSDI